MNSGTPRWMSATKVIRLSAIGLKETIGPKKERLGASFDNCEIANAVKGIAWRAAFAGMRIHEGGEAAFLAVMSQNTKMEKVT